MIQVHLLKRKRTNVKVDPKLGGQWKEKEKVPMLGGQWKVKEKVPMLSDQWKVKGKSFSPFFIFPPTNLLNPSNFPFDLKFLLYHGSRPLLTRFLPFLDL
jgi:hypothetical protein